MADVIDPASVRFVKEQVRVLCERARALKAEIDAMTTTWNAGINATIGSSGTDHVIENRAADGVADLTPLQAAQAVGNLIAMGAAINPQIISAPCVRPLSAS